MKPIRLGAPAGIPLLIAPSWFLLFGLTTAVLALQVYPDLYASGSRTTHIIMALASGALFFTSLVLHEMAHSLVARAYKIPVKNITLFVFGGVSQITREATRPRNELLIALSGPFVSLLLAVIFGGAWLLLGATDHRAFDLVLVWLAWMNGVLAVFNMLPAFPMDGGRVFRSLLWMITRNQYRSTAIAGWAGRIMGGSFCALGLLGTAGLIPLGGNAISGTWFVLIGFFMESSARQSLYQNRLRGTLAKYTAQELMNSNPPVIDAARSVASVASGVLDLNPRVTYFVERDGSLAGILSGYEMRALPRSDWHLRTAGDLMVPSAQLRPTLPGSLASDILAEMESADLLHMPVVEDGRVLGVIARDRIVGVLQQAGLVNGGLESGTA